MAIQNLIKAGLGPVDGLGKYEDNETRKDVEEAAEIVGLDFLINGLVNSRRQLIGLVAGHYVKAYHLGLEQAKKLYGTTRAENVDVVVTNANAKGNEASIAVLFSAPCIKEEGGDVVLIVDNPAGQVTHYLLSSFGKNIGGRLWNPQGYLPEKVKRVIVMTRYPDYSSGKWFAPPEKLHWVKSWEEVMAVLKTEHGPGTRAAVYIDGTMQFYR